MRACREVVVCGTAQLSYPESSIPLGSPPITPHRIPPVPVEALEAPDRAGRLAQHRVLEDELPLMANRTTTGFTLIEVLIAMAITAFVSMIAYTSLSTVMSGVESLRENTDRGPRRRLRRGPAAATH